jgi:CBS domain containing-hemolysin-like protein
VFGLNSGAWMTLGALALGLHVCAVALAQALRTYSRSRIEELCEQRGRPGRADEIARDDVATERAAELLAGCTGLGLAGILGALTAVTPERWDTGTLLAVAIVLGALGHLLAGVMGRVHAESIIDFFWPCAKLARQVTIPLVGALRFIESRFERRARGGAVASPRPPSVEVEIHTRSADDADAFEAELPEATRQMLERAVALRDRDVASLMTPRSSILVLPGAVSLENAARAFVDSGLSRIPLYGEHRDDIVGILYVKDLVPYLLDLGQDSAFQARKLARAPYFVPETKPASDLLEELRRQRVQLAIVLDEFGSVAGLITLEDVLEAIVGPIDDEHDTPTPEDPLVPLENGRFEADAAISLEDLNERLGLDLPTDRDFQTLGGLAYEALGQVPEPGAKFQVGGTAFTVLEVSEHAIRRLRIEPDPSRQPVGNS